jgi:hypothetical protein
MPDNGMVKRFNRRFGEHFGRMQGNRAAHHRRFRDHAERDAYLCTFVTDYNRTGRNCRRPVSPRPYCDIERRGFAATCRRNSKDLRKPNIRTHGVKNLWAKLRIFGGMRCGSFTLDSAEPLISV